MKKTDMERLNAARIESERQRQRSPARFGSEAAAAEVSRRERRRLEQAQGLIPFAVKIDAALAEQVRAKAVERSVSVDEVVAELLRKGLAA